MEIAKTNGGYEIIKSIDVDTLAIVLAKNEQGTQYATWATRNGQDFFWGHYFTKKVTAERDFLERALREFNFEHTEVKTLKDDCDTDFTIEREINGQPTVISLSEADLYAAREFLEQRSQDKIAEYTFDEFLVPIDFQGAVETSYDSFAVGHINLDLRLSEDQIKGFMPLAKISDNKEENNAFVESALDWISTGKNGSFDEIVANIEIGMTDIDDPDGPCLRPTINLWLPAELCERYAMNNDAFAQIVIPERHMDFILVCADAYCKKETGLSCEALLSQAIKQGKEELQEKLMDFLGE